MKAHWNKRSSFYSLAQTLLVLCCLVLLTSLPAAAQQAQVDQEGRTLLDRARRGAPETQIATPPTDVWNGCDLDDCSKRSVHADTPQDQVILGAQASALSLQIQPGAPTSSVFVGTDGAIGLGTKAPRGRLHVVAKPGQEDARDILLLDANGNLEIGGLLIEASSALLKENFAPVDAQDVLRSLADLPITQWNYKTDDPSVRHMGPTAQDFYAAFGLGTDGEHLAPLDANGVALAALQALYAQGQTQVARIAQLEAQNAQLLGRLEALEALIGQQK